MKFSELYPNMRPIIDEEDGVIRGKIAEPCCMCGTQTEYIDICSEAHFCGQGCRDGFYDEFMRRLTEASDTEEDF